MGHEKLFAYLSYRDAGAAIGWSSALGFTVVRRQDGEDGTLLHAEVRLGSIVLMVASNDAYYGHPPLRGARPGKASICSSTTSMTCAKEP